MHTGTHTYLAALAASAPPAKSRYRCAPLACAAWRRSFGRGDNLQASPVVYCRRQADVWRQLSGCWLTSRRNIVWCVGLESLASLTGLFAALDRGILSLAPPRPAHDASAPELPGAADRSPLFFLGDGIGAIRVYAPDGRHAVLIDVCNHLGKDAGAWMPEIAPAWAETPPPSPDRAAAEAHLAAQVEAVAAASAVVIRVISALKLPSIPLTFSAAALASAERGRAGKIVLPHGKPAVAALERAAYFGGLVRAWWCGPVISEARYGAPRSYYGTRRGPILSHGKIRCVDCNAMYGSVMASEPLPEQLIYHGIDPSMDELHGHAARGTAIARVYLRTDTPFPRRGGVGEMQWAVGSYWTTLCGPELRLACAMDLAHGVSEIAVFQLGTATSDWARRLLAMRADAKAGGDLAMARAVKLMLNGLHGKLGQRQRKWIQLPATIPLAPWFRWVDYDGASGTSVQHRSLGWDTEREDDCEDGAKGLIAYAAFVAAHGRCMLRAALAVVGPRGAYYSDTDSIHTDDAGVAALGAAGMLSETEPGKWKLDDAADLAVYYAPRQYRYDDDLVFAGLPHGRGGAQADRLTYDLRLSPFTARDEYERNSCRTIRCTWAPPWARLGASGAWLSWTDCDPVSEEFNHALP